MGNCRGQRDSITGRAFALYVVKPGCILGTTCYPFRGDLEFRDRRMLRVAYKQINNSYSHILSHLSFMNNWSYNSPVLCVWTVILCHQVIISGKGSPWTFSMYRPWVFLNSYTQSWFLSKVLQVFSDNPKSSVSPTCTSLPQTFLTGTCCTSSPQLLFP